MSGTEYYQHLKETVFKGGDWDWVWDAHPWMVNCYTGRIGEDHDRDIRWWLRENFNESDIYAKPPVIRDYKHGQATVDGWTWIGFTSEENLAAFQKEFPAHQPEGRK